MFGLVIAAFTLAFLSALLGVLRAGHRIGVRRGRKSSSSGSTGCSTATLSKADSFKLLHSLSRVEIWTDEDVNSEAIIDELRKTLLARLEIDYRGRLFVLSWDREQDKLPVTGDKLVVLLVGGDETTNEWESISPRSDDDGVPEPRPMEEKNSLLSSSAFILINCGVSARRVERLRCTLQNAGLWEAQTPLHVHTLDLSLLYHTISELVINSV